MEEKRTSPVKAIRLKCLDCCCGSSHEVKLCSVTNCPLYPFRFGKNPNRAGLGSSDHFKARIAHSTNETEGNSVRVV